MRILENELYLEDIENITKFNLQYSIIKNKSFLITGASGMIGSCLVDTLMMLNKKESLNIKVYALGRNEVNAKERFYKYWNDELFKFISCDINNDIKIEKVEKIDYIIHLASNTHPKAYAIYPIETITTNVIGTKRLLDYAVEHNCKRFVFASSVEIYGENRGDVEKFNEDYLGYINCNKLRAGYPESKRCGEALCQAYIKQKNMDIVIPRLSRCFGPTVLENDSKASSQFIKNGIDGKDIVLKSEGNQYYSYSYVTDAVLGILTVLLNGKNGEAYNISDESCDIRLKDMAQIIAKYVGKKVVFDLPDDTEKEGFSKATKARMDNKKIVEIGWRCQNDIKEALIKTIEIIKNMRG